MKKTGLVTQINKKYACIMTPSGEFSKVRYKAQIPALGAVYSGEVYSAPRLKLPLAAASLAFLLFSGGLYSYMAPAYAVTVDISPAVKLQVNMWNRIIGTEAVNEDGKKLLSGVSLKNMSVNGALEAIVSEAKKENYIGENNTTQNSEVRVIVEGKKDAPVALKQFSDSIKDKNINVKIITDGTSNKPSDFNTNQKPGNNSGVDKDSKTNSKDNGKGQEKNSGNNNKKDINAGDKGSEKNNFNNKDQSEINKHNTSKTSFSDIYNAKFNKKNK